VIDFKILRYYKNFLYFLKISIQPKTSHNKKTCNYAGFEEYGGA